MDKTALENLLSSYNWWMEASTVAVAVGILGEYVAHFIFEKEARRNRLEMTVSIIFGVFVLGGVVGEWIVGSKLSQASEQLQHIADTDVAHSNSDAAAARKEAERARKEADSFELEIAKANKGAAAANERAAKAEEHLGESNERAANALRAAGEAKRDAESFRLDIAKANEQAANAEKESARLSKAAEQERLARVKIEETLAWRTLSNEQKVRITNRIHPYVAQEFMIVTYQDDGECMDLMNAIYGTLVSAGWKYPNPQWSMLVTLVRGIVLRISPEASAATKSAGEALAAVLRREGIATTVEPNPDAGKIIDTIVIQVGKKQ